MAVVSLIVQTSMTGSEEQVKELLSPSLKTKIIDSVNEIHEFYNLKFTTSPPLTRSGSKRLDSFSRLSPKKSNADEEIKEDFPTGSTGLPTSQLASTALDHE